MEIKNIKSLLNPESNNFRPNILIKIMRFLSNFLTKVFFISGNTRWGNEFIQTLNPLCKSTIIRGLSGKGTPLVFRTGHGRLLWRAISTTNLEVETNEWIDSFNPKDVFFDVGANVGVYTLLAAKRKKCKVIAFEPDQFNTRYLHENIFLNRVNENVQIIPLALGHESSSETIFLSGLSPGGALNHLGSKNPFLDKTRSVFETTVPVISILDALRIFNLPQPTKMKLDVDGHEWNIIKEAFGDLPKLDSVCIELSEENEDMVKKSLEEKGFVLKTTGAYYHGQSRNLIFQNLV